MDYFKKEEQELIKEFTKQEGLNLCDFDDFLLFLEELNSKSKNLLENEILNKRVLKRFINDYQNIVRRVTKRLGITQAQLAEEICYSKSALNSASSRNMLSDNLKKAIELYYKNIILERELKNEKNKIKNIKIFLSNI